jgi:DNA processing protein
MITADGKERETILIERPTDEAEKAAVLNLVSATHVGAKSVSKLIDTFGSASKVLTADDQTLESVGRLSLDSIRDLREAQGNGFGEKQIERATRLGIRVLIPSDSEYPDLLSQIHSPPAALYVTGRKLLAGNKAVAVVGSRKSSEAGLEIAHQIGAGLNKAGVSVVSGMAYGVDAAAHRGSLQEDGNTVAVLGCGVDVIYPKQNRKLYDEIMRKGTIISELFLGAGPEARNFPMRNRIIAGTSVGTVVIEATKKSGSLITASMALNENRQVFAVPGHPFAENHEGSNFLLRQGATFIRHAGDLLEDLIPQLGLDVKTDSQMDLDLNKVPDDLSTEEKRVFKALDPVETIHADKLAHTLKIDTSRLGAMLLMLEMKGVVQRVPGDRYRRRVNRS